MYIFIYIFIFLYIYIFYFSRVFVKQIVPPKVVYNCPIELINYFRWTTFEEEYCKKMFEFVYKFRFCIFCIFYVLLRATQPD